MTHRSNAFAFELYRRFRSGQSAEHLATELAIPIERIRMRINAAAAYWQQRAHGGVAGGHGAGLVSGCGHLPVAA